MKLPLYFILLLFTVYISVPACTDKNKHDHADHSGHADGSSTTYYCRMCPGQEQDSPGTCKVCGMDLVPKEEDVHENKQIYTCPMHPEIVKDAPGICPICKMDLIIKETAGSNSVNGEMVKPVNAYVLAQLPLVKPVQKALPVKVNAAGYITYDPARINAVSSRFEGRIEKLYKRYEFQPVKKGEPLFEVFSHTLIAAQQEYLFLKNNEKDQRLLQKARKKLELLGLTSSQIEKLNGHAHNSSVTVFSPYTGYLVKANGASQNLSTGSSSMDVMDSEETLNNDSPSKEELIKEGAFIAKGEPVMKIANTDIVWAVLNVYANDIKGIKPGQSVSLVVQGISDTLKSKVNYIETVLNEQTQTIQIRVLLPNKDGSIKINSLVRSEILAEPISGLWVADKAVYDLGDKYIVFIKEGEYFRSTEVKTGVSSNGYLQILNGLSEEDEIASVASYLVDSESIIKVEK